MRKALSTLTAATAGLGVMVGAPSAAHAFVPAVVVAAWAVGAGLAGLFVGSAVTAIMHLTNKPRYATKGSHSEPSNVHRYHRPDFQ